MSIPSSPAVPPSHSVLRQTMSLVGNSMVHPPQLPGHSPMQPQQIPLQTLNAPPVVPPNGCLGLRSDMPGAYASFLEYTQPNATQMYPRPAQVRSRIFPRDGTPVSTTASIMPKVFYPRNHGPAVANYQYSGHPTYITPPLPHFTHAPAKPWMYHGGRTTGSDARNSPVAHIGHHHGSNSAASVVPSQQPMFYWDKSRRT